MNVYLNVSYFSELKLASDLYKTDLILRDFILEDEIRPNIFQNVIHD